MEFLKVHGAASLKAGAWVVDNAPITNCRGNGP